MDKFFVWEGFMEDLEKKIGTIKRKCARYGCEFHFAKTGVEEIRDIPDPDKVDPNGDPIIHHLNFIEVEAEGTAVINGWQFLAGVEHTEKGNIYSKALTDVEIPERYRNCRPMCEHCKADRIRKSTCIVYNADTDEFKMVGSNCLRDFTHGMSASFAAYVASLRGVFDEFEHRDPSGSWGGRRDRIRTREILQFTAETIRHFGYSKGNSAEMSTRGRTLDFWHVWHGDTAFWDRNEVARLFNLMNEVGFDPSSAEATEMVDNAIAWLDGQEERNDYMHNLKVVAALNFTDYSRVGLLVSLFPTYNRDLEAQAKRRAEALLGKNSEYVGNVGDRVEVEVDKVKCITSWENCFNGYYPETTYVWKIVGKDGNIYTWKTSRYLNEDNPPKTLKGTVKAHKEFREVKQTELTRCRAS